jgi:hypothetical protein
MGQIKILNSFRSVSLDDTGAASIKFLMPVDIRDFSGAPIMSVSMSGDIAGIRNFSGAPIMSVSASGDIQNGDRYFTSSATISSTTVTTYHYFDNTYWTATSGSWNGTQWESALGQLVPLTLIPAGGWSAGFKPASIKIDYTINNDPDPGNTNVQLKVRTINNGPIIVSKYMTNPAPFNEALDFSVAGIGGETVPFDVFYLSGGSNAQVFEYVGFTKELRSTISVTDFYNSEIAVDDSRNVYLSGREDNWVERYNSAGTQTGKLTGFARSIWGVAWYGGNLYTLESTSENYPVPNLYIVKYDGFSKTSLGELSLGQIVYRPRSLAISPVTGNMLITGSVGSATGNNHIIEYVGFTTTINQNIDHSALPGMSGASGTWIDVAPSGNLVVSAYNVDMIEYSGISTTEVGRMRDKYGANDYFGNSIIAVAAPAEATYPATWKYDEIESIELRVWTENDNSIQVSNIQFLEYPELSV